MIPQAFLNGFRASTAAGGMGDVRNPAMRSADQALTQSGNPNMVYNRPLPTKPMRVGPGGLAGVQMQRPGQMPVQQTMPADNTLGQRLSGMQFQRPMPGQLQQMNGQLGMNQQNQQLGNVPIQQPGGPGAVQTMGAQQMPQYARPVIGGNTSAMAPPTLGYRRLAMY